MLLQLCRSLYTSTGIRPLTEPDRQRILAQTTAMAQQALRVLGSAYRDLENTSPSDLTAEAGERELVFAAPGSTPCSVPDSPRQDARGG